MTALQIASHLPFVTMVDGDSIFERFAFRDDDDYADETLAIPQDDESRTKKPSQTTVQSAGRVGNGESTCQEPSCQRVALPARKRAKTDVSLLEAVEVNSVVTPETDPQVLIERWQSMAIGASTADLRRFYVRSPRRSPQRTARYLSVLFLHPRTRRRPLARLSASSEKLQGLMVRSILRPHGWQIWKPSRSQTSSAALTTGKFFLLFCVMSRHIAQKQQGKVTTRGGCDRKKKHGAHRDDQTRLRGDLSRCGQGTGRTLDASQHPAAGRRVV